MGKVNLHDTIDAEVWVQEWLSAVEKNPSIPTDGGAMLSWFANALMAGYDHAVNEYRAEEEIDCDTLSVNIVYVDVSCPHCGTHFWGLRETHNRCAYCGKLVKWH
jgi:hypothetical protein